MDTNLGRVIGYDGKQIELSRDSLYIKWRYVGDAVWKNLIALNDLKVGLPKGGKTDQVLAKLSNNDWDYVWKTPESGGGSIDTIQLASVTTAPVAPFPINTKYYNADDNTIYRATEENTWENADTEEPILGAFYIYDDEIYFYDKKFQSLYMVKTIPSTIFYANKIMEAGESSINMEVDLSNSLILSVHVNGHFQTYGKNYTISTENEESTIYFDESVDEDSEVDVVYSSYMELSGGGGVSDYSQLTNKPKINNVELKGNKTSDNLGLQDKITTDNKLSVNLVSGLAPIATSGSYNDLSNTPAIDNTLNDNSENAVQNKVIKAAIDGKATSSTTLSGYGITDAYTKTEVDTSLSNKQASLSETQLSAVNSGITSSKVTTYDNYAINKQDTLVSGTNIKTINNMSILGSGNINIDSFKCALQVTCSYNNDVLKGVAVVVDSNTIITKSNGLATFTGLDSGTKSIVASKDGFATNTSSKVVENSFETADVEMNPITLTFTVKDVENNVIVGATITLGDYTATTNDNGQAVISGILDGVYNYIITKATFTNATGIISINRQNVNQPVIMISALIVGKASGSFLVGDTVKLNAGMGENNYDFTAYPSDTAQTNDLTIDGEVAEVKTDSIVLTEEPQIENAEITIEVNQDNADIEFNNGNNICTVNIVANMPETHNYLAFRRQSDNSIIYFKDRTYPFVPSDNTYPQITFTYYTYENNEMISHNATTQSQTEGDTIYDGKTLIIHSSTVSVDGTWIRQAELDETIETEYDGATIITSSYLTTPEAVIPTTNNSKFAMEKSNDYDVILVVGGAFTTLANLQEIIVPNNTIIDTYMTLKDGQPAKLLKNTYFKRYTITNDFTLRKVKLSLIINVSAKVTFTINGISKIIENTQLAQIDVYAGETINYTVEAEGYTSQTGSYVCPQYPTVKENIVNITL